MLRLLDDGQLNPMITAQEAAGAAPLQPANALGGPTALQGALPSHLQQLLASQIAQARL